jgi:hypothetical protein
METISLKIERSLYEYHIKNINEPYGILVNPTTLKGLVDEIREVYNLHHIDPYNEDIKYRGIKLYISEQLSDNEIKIII